MQGWARAEGPDAQRYSFYSSFFNYAISADRIEQRDGYELGKLGLTLPPGRSGAIVFRLERPPDALVLLKANFYNRRFAESGALATTGAAFSNALEISTDQGQSYRTVLADASLGEVVGSPALDLTRFLGPSRTYWLRFRAHNSTESEVTVLPSVVVSTVTDPLALPHPAFPIVAYLAAVAAVAYTVCRRAGRRPRDAGAAALALSTGAAVVVALVRSFGGHPAGASAPAAAAAQAAATLAAGAGGPDLRYALLASRAAFALAAALPVALSWRWRRVGPPVARGPRTPWLVLGCLLVALVALDARWEQLMRVRYEFLLPDAQGYQAIAEQVPEKLAHYVTQRASPLLSELYAAGYDGRASAPAVFYAGGNNGREPLWPATLRLVFNVLGASAFHTRLTSLACGVLVAVLTCWVAWRLLHPLAGVTAGALLALNRPHIVNSVAGLREELVSALLLLLLSGLFVGARRGSPATWWRAAGVGAAAAAVVLVRADMVVLAGALLTGAALVLRWPWRRWFVAVGLMGLLAAPMYLGYAFTHGDPFYPGTYGATVNRNLEFPERMGTPGFPSPEEYAANWAAGPPVSPMQYFFGYHTLPQFVGYTVRGFIRIFPTVLFEQQPVVLWLFVAGMGLLLICRRWVVPFALVIALVPFYAFLAGVPNSWVFPGRYAHHALPYAEMGAAYALWFVPLGIVGRWRGRHGRRAGTSAALRGA
jgi:4-amino-4-deoxy-L-arabinose transferase-like glycosyltransferase